VSCGLRARAYACLRVRNAAAEAVLDEVVDAGRRADGGDGRAACGGATDASPGPRETTSRAATDAEREAKWEATLRSLVKYHEEHGCMPPPGSEGRRWLDSQKRRLQRQMSEKRKEKVRSAGGPVAVAILNLNAPDVDRRPHLEVWEENLGFLVDYYETYGSMPPRGSEDRKWLDEQQRLVDARRMEQGCLWLVRKLLRDGYPSGRDVAAEILGSRYPGYAPKNGYRPKERYEPHLHPCGAGSPPPGCWRVL